MATELAGNANSAGRENSNQPGNHLDENMDRPNVNRPMHVGSGPNPAGPGGPGSLLGRTTPTSGNNLANPSMRNQSGDISLKMTGASRDGYGGGVPPHQQLSGMMMGDNRMNPYHRPGTHPAGGNPNNPYMSNSGGHIGGMSNLAGYNGTGFYGNEAQQRTVMGSGGYGGGIPPATPPNQHMVPGNMHPNMGGGSQPPNQFNQYDGHLQNRGFQTSVSRNSASNPMNNYAPQQQRISSSAPTLSQLLQGQKPSPNYSAYSSQNVNKGADNHVMGMLGNQTYPHQQWGQRMPLNTGQLGPPGYGQSMGRNQMNMMPDGSPMPKRPSPFQSSPYQQGQYGPGGRPYPGMPPSRYPMTSRSQPMPSSVSGNGPYSQQHGSQNLTSNSQQQNFILQQQGANQKPKEAESGGIDDGTSSNDFNQTGTSVAPSQQTDSFSQSSQSPHLHPTVSALRPSTSPVGSPSSHMSRSSVSPASIHGGSITPQPPSMPPPPASQSDSSTINQMNQSPMSSQERGHQMAMSGYPNQQQQMRTNIHSTFPPYASMAQNQPMGSFSQGGGNMAPYAQGMQGPMQQGNIGRPHSMTGYDGYGSNPNVPGPNMPGPNMAGPNMSGPNMPGPSMPGPNMTGPNMTGPNMPGPNMPGPNMPGPNMPGPNIPGPNIPGPNMPGPNMPGSAAMGDTMTLDSRGPRGASNMDGLNSQFNAYNSGNMPSMPHSNANMKSPRGPNAYQRNDTQAGVGTGAPGADSPSSIRGAQAAAAAAVLAAANSAHKFRGAGVQNQRPLTNQFPTGGGFGGWPPQQNQMVLGGGAPGQESDRMTSGPTIENGMPGKSSPTNLPVPSDNVDTKSTADVMKQESVNTMEAVEANSLPTIKEEPSETQQDKKVTEPPTPPEGITGASPVASSGDETKSSQDNNKEVNDVKPPTVKREKKDPSYNKIERLYELCDHPDRKPFLDTLVKLMEAKGEPIVSLPTSRSGILDLFKLYRNVQEKGGLAEVSKNKLWKEIASTVHFGTTNHAGYTVKKHYEKFLLSYEYEHARASPKHIYADTHHSNSNNSSASSPGINSIADLPNSIASPSLDNLKRPPSQTSQPGTPGDTRSSSSPMMPQPVPQIPNTDNSKDSITVRDPFDDAIPNNTIARPNFPGRSTPNTGMDPTWNSSVPGSEPFMNKMAMMNAQGNDMYSGRRNAPSMPQDSFNRRPMPSGPGMGGNRLYGPQFDREGMNQGGPMANNSMDQSMYPSRYGGQPPQGPRPQGQDGSYMAPPYQGPYPGQQPQGMFSNDGIRPNYPQKRPPTDMVGPSPKRGPDFMNQGGMMPRPNSYRGGMPPFSQQSNYPPQPGNFASGDPGMNTQSPFPKPNHERHPGPMNSAGMYSNPYSADQSIPPIGGGPSMPVPPPGPPNSWAAWSDTHFPNSSQGGPKRDGYNAMRFRDGHGPSPSWGTMQQRPGGSPYSNASPGMLLGAQAGAPRLAALMSATREKHHQMQQHSRMRQHRGQMSQSSHVQKEVIYPPGSVEAKQPSLVKRRRLKAKDCGAVEAMRLTMCLKSGLLAESRWALDMMNILLFDDSTVMYFDLKQLPGLLELVMDHFRACLVLLFEQFKDLELKSNKQLDMDNKNKCSKRTDKPCVTNSTDKTKCNEEDFKSDVDRTEEFLEEIPERTDYDKEDFKTVKDLLDVESVQNVTTEKLKGRDKSKNVGLVEASAIFLDEIKEWDVYEGFESDKTHWSLGGGDLTQHIVNVFEKKKQTVFPYPGLKLKESSPACEPQEQTMSSEELIDSLEPFDKDNQEKKLTYASMSKKRDDEIVLEDEGLTNDVYALCVSSEYKDSISRLCVCISNILRSLSFIPGNDIELVKHTGFLLVIGRLLLMSHCHPERKVTNTSSTPKDKDDSLDDCPYSDKFQQSWDCLNQLRENALVILSNICGHLDLSIYPEKICMPILDGLLHWVVCPSSYAVDPFPSLPASSPLSPKRLALETLAKLTLKDNNVDMVLATPPFTRIQRVFTNLVQHLVDRKNPVVREFSVVLLSNLANGSSIAGRAIACQTASISNLISFIEDFELASNPASVRDLVEPDKDMMRRAAYALSALAKVPENRPLFIQYQARLLNIAIASASSVNSVPPLVQQYIGDVLYEISLS
ncbi:AT-rich interactive domain-containing protein 1B-like isoform X2 [Anneissia japonica]|uniref:AT-rich interactive domain-containing protein 1B-like isoform X2 n=1 Tax=Anneissia japonica TaxID=1529436 RepID=UPI0014254EFC|nr:AT-rich interactive domain-containing protein 1B-like isoform X2 [Anneissia japonica]